MGFPGEEMISTAIEKFSDGIIQKMNEAEAKRDREFTLKLKELEFYKTQYTKELKEIFDYWFDLVRVTHIKDNKNISEQERNNYERRYKDLMKVDKIALYKMNTLKYGGKETGRIFAMQSKILQPAYSNQPASTAFYLWCTILCVLKHDILGQELDPLDVIQVLVNDYDDNEGQIIEARRYVLDLYKNTYQETPFWAYE